MPPVEIDLDIPELRTLITRMQADIATDTGEEDVRIRQSFPWALARALSGSLWGLYKFAESTLAELHPATAKDWGIAAWGQSWGIPRLAAASAQEAITITFTGAATVPLGAVYTREDGAEYTLDAAVTRVGAGTSAGAVTAVTAGAAGSCDTATVLSLSTPIVNVTTDAVTTSETTAGSDEETLSEWQERILARMADTPQGGSDTDYIAWTRAVDSTIDKVWVFSHVPYLGNVTVRFTIFPDPTASQSARPATVVPGGTLITDVQTAIRALSPANAKDRVYAAAPSTRTIEARILLSNDSVALQTAVEDELDSMFQNIAISTTTTTTLYEDDIRAAIRLAVKEDDPLGSFTLVTIEGIAPANVTVAASTIPIRGVVTWV